MKRILAVPLACAVLAVAGCGDDEETDNQSAAPPPTTETTPTETTPTDDGDDAGTVLENPADASGALEFEKSSLRAQSGQITLEMPNPSSVPHAISVRGDGVDEDGNTVQKGGTSKVTVTLKPGEYEFYCPVGGHEQAGMKGKLTVE